VTPLYFIQFKITFEVVTINIQMEENMARRFWNECVLCGKCQNLTKVFLKLLLRSKRGSFYLKFRRLQEEFMKAMYFVESSLPNVLKILC